MKGIKEVTFEYWEWMMQCFEKIDLHSLLPQPEYYTLLDNCLKKIHNPVKTCEPTNCGVRKITQLVYNFTQVCTILQKLCIFSLHNNC